MYTEDTLLGAVQKNAKGVATRIQDLGRAAAAAVKGNSRAAAIERFSQFAPDDQEALTDQRAQFTDETAFATKSSAGASVRIFNTDDSIEPGKNNIAKAKLETGFVVTHIQVLSGINASYTSADMGIIAEEVAKGSFTLKVDGTELIRRGSMRKFDTTGRTDVQQGMYALDNPKFIPAEKEIDFSIDFAATLSATTWFTVIFHGTAVRKS